MEYKKYPRTLVISMNAFSKGNSNNGKVLSQYFSEWDKNCIAQFFVMNEEPDSPFCERYYRMTDKEAMRACLTGKKGGSRINVSRKEFKNEKVYKKVSKIPRYWQRLIRDIVWNCGRWYTKDLENWIKEFEPEILLVMIGGSSFIPNIAMKLAKKFNLPIVIYNTESYYFEKVSLFNPVKWIYRKEGNRAIKKIIKRSSEEIYLNEKLKELYAVKFGKEGCVLYQSTELVPSPKKDKSQELKFLYAGNINLGREQSLIQIAKALQNISPEYILDVYGGADVATEQELHSANGIRYHGKVEYERVLSAIEESDFIFHAESFEARIVKNLTTAFSTKIADSLASGRCFVIYAPETLACVEYLKRFNCACVINSRSELEVCLSELINSKEAQKGFIERAISIAQENHNSKVNCERMRVILSRQVRGYYESNTN